MEKNFIHRLQQRENRAYVELYDYYFARLHRLAANYVFDVETAKDIVQSVFVSLYERIDTCFICRRPSRRMPWIGWMTRKSLRISRQ